MEKCTGLSEIKNGQRFTSEGTTVCGHPDGRARRSQRTKGKPVSGED